MEDPNRDAQGSETSSEDSWILLSNEEAATDLAFVEVNKNCRVNSLEAVIQTLSDVDIKNIQSDIESDSISIMSESELSQNSGSDDDCKNTTVEIKSEKYDDKKDLSVKGNKSHCKNLYKGDTMDLESKCTAKKENCIFYTAEDIPNLNLREELHAVVKTENMGHKENLPSLIMDETLNDQAPLYNFLNNYIQKYHLKKLVTMPSFLCTSVVIFAVLIFPYFSSKMEDVNTLDQPNVKQFDSMPEKNMEVVDPLVYCMEIHKNDNLFYDYNVKRCMKKLLKQMRKFKKNDITVQFIPNDNEIQKNIKKTDWIENNDERHVKTKDSDFKRKKYKSQDRYNNLNTHDRGESKKLLVLEEYDANLSGEDRESYSEQYKFINDLIKNNERHTTENLKYHQGKEDIMDHSVKRFEKQFVIEKFDELKKELNEMKKSLLEKEKFLKKWEEQLTERELNIQKTVKKHKVQKNENNSKKHKSGKFNKQKGDFDKDVHERKFKKSEKHMNNILRFKDKQEKNGKHPETFAESTDWQKSHAKFSEDDDKENWVKSENILKMKSVLHSRNQRNYIRKKKAASVLLWGTNNEESSKKVSILFDHNKSKYLRVQSIVEKNQTQNLDDDNITFTGEWYLNLVHGRDNIRKKEGKASWWFDRVEFRKNKRNKAFWYFRYMLNRENLRYRHRNI